jgi:hypothetical protein
MQASLIAMLASGFRPATSEAGHHQLLIQALPKTIGLEADRVRVLDALRAARNQSDYGGTSVSDSVATESLEEAGRLVREVRAWLETYHPEVAQP